MRAEVEYRFAKGGLLTVVFFLLSCEPSAPVQYSQLEHSEERLDDECNEDSELTPQGIAEPQPFRCYSVNEELATDGKNNKDAVNLLYNFSNQDLVKSFFEPSGAKDAAAKRNFVSAMNFLNDPPGNLTLMQFVNGLRDKNIEARYPANSNCIKIHLSGSARLVILYDERDNECSMSTVVGLFRQHTTKGSDPYIKLLRELGCDDE